MLRLWNHKKSNGRNNSCLQFQNFSHTSLHFNDFFGTNCAISANEKIGKFLFLKNVNSINFSFWKSSPIIYIKHLKFEKKKLLTNNTYANNDNNIIFRVFNMSSSCFLFQFCNIGNLAQKIGWSCTNFRVSYWV